MLAALLYSLKNFKIVLLLVFISIFIYFAYGYLMDSKTTTTGEKFTSQLGKEVVFFSMNGCGHCDDMMPAWKLLVRNYGSENAYVEYRHVVAQERPDLIEKYNIQSFPTILALKDGEISQKYEGDRSYEDLLRFANYAMTN